MTQYNIYYGTIGKTLGVRYHQTKNFKSEQEAKQFAKTAAASYFYKHEGTCGLPSFEDISKESELTGLSIEKLYEDHIKDMTRYYVIPTKIDTVLSQDICW